MNSVEEVREIVRDITQDPVIFDDYAVKLARFARSVLEPPAEIVKAMENERQFPGEADIDCRAITDYFLKLTAPAGEPHA